MSDCILQLRYRSADGDVDDFTLISWREEGHYIIGYPLERRGVRTLRKDRVLAYRNGCDRYLRWPDAPPPVLRQREVDPLKALPQIVFTGFGTHERGALEQIAANAGLRVVKSVTVGLMYLCAGPNAGPVKLQRARQQRVYIMSEPQFLTLLETGELPHDET